MTRRQALQLAIDALQKQYRYNLYASDSEAADKRRIEINKAIVILDNLKRQREMKL